METTGKQEMLGATSTECCNCSKNKQCEYHQGYDRATKDLLRDEKNHTKDMRNLGWVFGFYLIVVILLSVYSIFNLLPTK